MGGDPHSPTSAGTSGSTVTVFTDGACSGNPGPGGWAWVQPGGAWAAGYDPDTTNQRMEVAAALEACERFDGPLRIVSDSTYVVNCWRDRWWQGWLKRGWKNSQKKPVANRDLWEQLVPHFRDRENLVLEWVKGHSGDEWNDIADRLAVGAVQRGEGAEGAGPPADEFLGNPDEPTGPAVAPAGAARSSEASSGGPASRSAARRAADPRVPEGHVLVVAGLRSHEIADDASTRESLRAVIEGQRQMYPDLVVLSGLRAGAESLAAEVALAAGADLAVILPYPDPAQGWPERERSQFEKSLDVAREVVVLEKERPADLDGRRKSLARRDGWLRSVADLAVVLTDGRDAEAESALKQWEKVLGEEVWRLDVAQ